MFASGLVMIAWLYVYTLQAAHNIRIANVNYNAISEKCCVVQKGLQNGRNWKLKFETNGFFAVVGGIFICLSVFLWVCNKQTTNASSCETFLFAIFSVCCVWLWSTVIEVELNKWVEKDNIVSSFQLLFHWRNVNTVLNAYFLLVVDMPPHWTKYNIIA